MPLALGRSSVRASLRRSLDLPPPFRAIALREVGDAFAHAVTVADQLRVPAR